ncbi:HEAT repeat domain-containing protein [Amorphoplanes digitatis]|uniref:HEAT repeat domain-containing protein n=1 Tax=Actinoplanes digitatis TaxID=1868 RepID=A0A7W7MRD8_9ACTN|nr:hypothetical protein [Actinoplanes digitatis]MBB4763642.1 hypothetical protein [Actinoplanes digitatis]
MRTVDLDAGLGDAADHDAFEAALTGAVGAGAPGERALLAALAATSDEERFCGLVAALGEADGPDGSAVLGDIALRPGMSAAVRLCALIALAKRAGVAATDVYARALADPDDEVRGDALLALASAGDDRAQPAVLAELRRRLEVRSRIPLFDMDERALSFQSKILSAVCYLGRHAAGDEARQRAVTGVVRPRWDRLYGAEQRWLTTYWPACDPARPAAFNQLDPTWLADWVSWPLFNALFEW